MTGRNRRRPGLQQALAAVRTGDTMVVPKLDRLARSVPDARAIGDSLGNLRHDGADGRCAQAEPRARSSAERGRLARQLLGTFGVVSRWGARRAIADTRLLALRS